MATNIKCDTCGKEFSEKEWEGVTHSLVIEENDSEVIEKDLCFSCNQKLTQNILKAFQKYFKLTGSIIAWDATDAPPNFRL